MSDFLILKRGIFHARLDIPVDVREAFGNRRVLTKSLRTGVKSEANQRKYEFIELWKRQIAQARGTFQSQSKQNWREDASYFAETLPILNGEIHTMERLNILLDLQKKHNVKKSDDLTELRDILYKQSEYTPKTMFTDKRLQAYSEFQKNRIITKSLDMQISRIKKFRSWLEKNSTELNFDSVNVYLNNLKTSLETKKANVFSFSSFFKWAVKYDPAIRESYRNTPSPFDGHDLKERLNVTTQQRIAFSKCDVKQLYGNSDNDSLKAAIKIAVYTGMRAEEIFQIKKSEVFEQDGIKYIDIQRAKNRASMRKVPVHSAIYGLFDKLINENPNDEYLMPSPAGNKYGKRSDAMSKRFGRYRTAQGFGSEYVFHSLRKTLVTELQRNGIEPLTITSIVGHKTNSITFDIYSAGPSLKQKSDALESLNFEI